VRIDPISGASQNIDFQGATGVGTVQSVAADPENSQSIYATGFNGVFHSQDGGNTWTSLAPLPSGADVFSVTVDPTNSRTLYASTAPSGAFKSTDGGATWTAINKGVPPASDGTLVDVYQIRVTISTTVLWPPLMNPRRLWKARRGLDGLIRRPTLRAPPGGKRLLRFKLTQYQLGLVLAAVKFLTATLRPIWRVQYA
jgi:hypothetical protein